MTSELKLPANFEDYTDAKKNGFLRVMKLKEEGKKVVGTFCSYTPSELVMAADGVCVGLCGSSEDGIAFAEKTLPKNMCPLIKCSYGLAASDACPYFYFSDMILAETTCDGKKKMFELMKKLKPVHVMQLPPGREGTGALDFWEQEIRRAALAIGEQLGKEITEEALHRAIVQKNRERRAMVELYEVGRMEPCPVSGYEISTIMDSLQFMFTSEEKIKLLEEKRNEFLARAAEDGKGRRKPRIMITGCPTIGVRDKIIKQAELLGASVVAFDSCSGPRAQKEAVSESGDPYLALAKKYLNINCAVMSPNPGRLDALDEMIADYRIDGVIEVVLQACHTFAIEAAEVKRFITKEKKLPYLYLETDYSQADSGQIDTRLSAFLEMMQ
ncbi:double-cubane-cluster-containing anaerobic reductase [Bacilliculturomica massiliensis]|uniref:double-cubane-cluster-containing anaerobic reductase n=1 Tax=Bacilliculturomica massiliensis TaxID=1917867 RepID=UPI0010324864|nr:double-cubane-cluster-containing anaerobic reductase [Bacilliculturomica massiliensis]